MNVLVTGANGLLGHHVVMELLNQHHGVHIIVRSKKNIFFDLNAVHVVEGDFTDYYTLLQAASHCNAIIHIAAVTATDLLKYDDYRSVNVAGTALVLRIASELNIHRIVYISSANTVGYGNEQLPGDERFNIQLPFTESLYAQSKAESETLMVEASQKANRHVVIINPTFMIGSYDTKPSSGKLILMGYKRKLLFIPGGGKNFVSVRNVAIAACNALTQGRNGERYLASGVNLSFKKYYTLQQEVGRYSQHIIILPDLVLVVLGKIGDVVRMMGIKTDLCSMNLKQLIIREYYTNAKARNELNLPDTDIKPTIKEAIDWFKEHTMA